jgi:multisubunit Na+/H+ antiporter MnhB subunit
MEKVIKGGVIVTVALVLVFIAYRGWPVLSIILGSLVVLGLLGLLRVAIALLSHWIISTLRGNRDGRGH